MMTREDAESIIEREYNKYARDGQTGRTLKDNILDALFPECEHKDMKHNNLVAGKECETCKEARDENKTN